MPWCALIVAICTFVRIYCWWKEPCSTAMAMYTTGQILCWCKSAHLVNENWKCNLLSMCAVQTPSWEKTSVLWRCPIPCPLTLIKAEYFSADSQRQMDFVNFSWVRGGYLKNIVAFHGAETILVLRGESSMELHIMPCSPWRELGYHMGGEQYVVQADPCF